MTDESMFTPAVDGEGITGSPRRDETTLIGSVQCGESESPDADGLPADGVANQATADRINGGGGSPAAAGADQPVPPVGVDLNTPYWLRPALFPDERFTLAEKIANAISASGVMGLTGSSLSAQVRKTGDMKLIEVIVSRTGIEGGMTIDLPQDKSGVVVEFPTMRHRKLGARIVQVVKHLEGQYGSRFVIPGSYPLAGDEDVAGRPGGAARIAALGTEGVGTMMAAMREKRWGGISDMSVKIAVKFDVFGLAKKMDDEMEKEGVPAYKRGLIRKRVAKMLADYIVVEGN